MSLMLGKLHDALLAGGTPPDKAQAASEEVAAYESRIATAEARLSLLTWMVGVNIALTSAVLFKVMH